MTNDTARHLLLAFLTGQEPFARTAEKRGHASSLIPDDFLTWFSGNEPEDRATLSGVLIDVVLEGDLEFHDYLRQACFLMVEVAAHFPSNIPARVIQKAEELLQRGDLVKAWLEDQESDDDSEKDFRNRWRFALSLWNVLHLVGSKAAERSFEVFVRRSKDPQFVRSLKAAREI